MQSTPPELPYLAVFRDGPLADQFARTNDLPPIWNFVAGELEFTGHEDGVTYFLREADSDGVGLYSTKTTNQKET